MSPIQIVVPDLTHAHVWAALRFELWPETDRAQHEAEILAFIAEAAEGRGQVGFLAMQGGEAVGFAEASIRKDYVNGCETSPVAFLEGIYVQPTCRRRGVGGGLLALVEAWGRANDCTELGSDAALTNGESQAFHRGLGFEETERVVLFRKAIDLPGVSGGHDSTTG